MKKTEKDKRPEFNELIAKNMGTTANVLFIKNNYIYLANVGDSMAVIFKNGEAIRLNQEHKVTLISESSRISKSGAKIINNRIDGRLNLTRAIGILIKILIYLVFFYSIIPLNNMKFSIKQIYKHLDPYPANKKLSIRHKAYNSNNIYIYKFFNSKELKIFRRFMFQK